MSLQHHNPSHSAPSAKPAHADGDRDASARLAHELANLLDGSLRNLGLAISSLGDSSQPSDKLEHRLQVANAAMHHMAELIHRWMRSSRSPGDLYHQPRMLEETVDHAVRLLTPAAALRQIDIRVNLDPGTAALHAGPIYPVVANALRNSIEAIDRGADASDPPVIEIAARLDDGHVELTVTDTGPGLDPALTDEAGRFKFGTTTKPSGHGLGLGLCRDIAREMGGSIELANREPRGAVLTFRYPVQNITVKNE